MTNLNGAFDALRTSLNQRFCPAPSIVFSGPSADDCGVRKRLVSKMKKSILAQLNCLYNAAGSTALQGQYSLNACKALPMKGLRLWQSSSVSWSSQMAYVTRRAKQFCRWASLRLAA